MNAAHRPRCVRQAGFSLLEMAVTILLFSIMAGTLQLSLTRRQLEEVDRNQAEQVADEVYRLANAAQHYEIQHLEWPHEILGCDGAYDELEARNLLKGAPEDSPYLDADENLTPYRLSCDANHFTIEVTAENANQAADLAHRLPGSTATGATVAVHYPKAANAPGNNFMPLNGSSRPTGTWDMGNQYMFGVRDVVAETGQTLANSLQFATITAPQELIQKPNCPNGMEPRIFTALNHIRAPSGKPLHGIALPVDDLDDFWRVRAVVISSGGEETPASSAASIAAFIKCSY